MRRVRARARPSATRIAITNGDATAIAPRGIAWPSTPASASTRPTVHAAPARIPAPSLPPIAIPASPAGNATSSRIGVEHEVADDAARGDLVKVIRGDRRRHERDPRRCRRATRDPLQRAPAARCRWRALRSDRERERGGERQLERWIERIARAPCDQQDRGEPERVDEPHRLVEHWAISAIATTTSARIVAIWAPVISVYAVASTSAGGAAQRAGRIRPPHGDAATSRRSSANTSPATTARCRPDRSARGRCRPFATADRARRARHRDRRSRCRATRRRRDRAIADGVVDRARPSLSACGRPSARSRRGAQAHRRDDRRASPTAPTRRGRDVASRARVEHAARRAQPTGRGDVLAGVDRSGSTSTRRHRRLAAPTVRRPDHRADDDAGDPIVDPIVGDRPRGRCRAASEVQRPRGGGDRDEHERGAQRARELHGARIGRCKRGLREARADRARQMIPVT